MNNQHSISAWTPDETEWQLATRRIYDAFGVPTEPESSEIESQLRPAARRVAVAHNDTIIGGCFAYDFALSLVGGGTCQAAGLAGVGITPAAQGSGGLRSMMQTHLQQSLDHNDAASLLMASESGIYRRYGYGVASELVRWQIDLSRFQLTREACLPPASEIRLIHDRTEAIPALAGIHRHHCGTRAMEVVRDDLWWRYMLLSEEPGWVSVGVKKFIAVHYAQDDSGSVDIPSAHADGYAIYSIISNSDEQFNHGRSNSTVVLTELIATNLSAELALFQYLSRLPWCRELIWELGPVDPPVRHFMTDPRQLWQQSRVDMMWLRPLDVQVLLEARQYHSAGSVVINYIDEHLPALCGCWRLTVADDPLVANDPLSSYPATVSQVGATVPSVQLTPSDFATVYAGAVRVAELAAVGRISGDTESIRTLDRLFTTARPPFNSTRF